MKVVHRIENQTVILSLYGNFAADGVGVVKHLLDSLLTGDQIKTVILNLDDVTILDSDGIGLLVRTHKTLLQRGSGLVLCEVSPKYMDILSISGISKVLRVYETEKEALSQVHP